MPRSSIALAVIGTMFWSAAAQGVTLSLRPTGAESGTPLTLEPLAEGSFEIVLDLLEGESAEFVTLFLDATGDAGVVEAFDLASDLPSPPAVYGRVAPLDQELPLAAGEGFSPGEYALLLSDAALTGPGVFVLERVLVRAGAAEGELTVRFAAGVLTPDIADAESNTVEAIVSPTPLVIRVREASGGNGGGAAGAGCGGMCGAGAGMAMVLGVIGLATISRHGRRVRRGGGRH